MLLLQDMESREPESGEINESDEEKCAPGGGRFDHLTEAELSTLEEEKYEKGTSYVTGWGVRILQDWCKSVGENPSFENLEVHDLASLLRRLYGGTKKQDGTAYSYQSLRGLRASIHRHLTSPPFSRAINILQDKEFMSANNVLRAMMKRIKREGKDKSHHKTSIRAEDIKKMFSSGTLSTSNPTSLLRLVWFHTSLFFCRRGREGLTSLKRDSFAIKKDAAGKEYATMVFNEATKNHPGNLQHDFDGEKRMYAKPESNVCPVAVLKLYMSKLNPKQEAFFQHPYSSTDGETHAWYCNAPVGKNKIGAMMKQISKDAVLSQIYTNHCVRATTITVLNEAGCDSRTIMGLSGHRNESSIKHYCRDPSEKHKVDMSAVLHNVIDPDSIATTSSQHRPSLTVAKQHVPATNSTVSMLPVYVLVNKSKDMAVKIKQTTQTNQSQSIFTASSLPSE